MQQFFCFYSIQFERYGWKNRMLTVDNPKKVSNAKSIWSALWCIFSFSYWHSWRIVYYNNYFFNGNVKISVIFFRNIRNYKFHWYLCEYLNDIADKNAYCAHIITIILLLIILAMWPLPWHVPTCCIIPFENDINLLVRWKTLRFRIIIVIQFIQFVTRHYWLNRIK